MIHLVKAQGIVRLPRSGLKASLPPASGTTHPEHDQFQGDPMRARSIPMWIGLEFVLMAAVSLSAQTCRGTILGNVTDASGAVIAGAKVTVKNTGTGLERVTQTSGDGGYSVPELPIGTYTVTVTQPGFQTFITTGVTVDVATERRVDAAMKTGEITTKVEASGDELPLVDTTTNTLACVLPQNDT